MTSPISPAERAAALALGDPYFEYLNVSRWEMPFRVVQAMLREIMFHPRRGCTIHFSTVERRVASYPWFTQEDEVPRLEATLRAVEAERDGLKLEIEQWREVEREYEKTADGQQAAIASLSADLAQKEAIVARFERHLDHWLGTQTVVEGVIFTDLFPVMKSEAGKEAENAELWRQLAEADARIAALVAALKQLLEASSIAESDFAYDQGEQDEAHEQARTAIAKAEGKP